MFGMFIILDYSSALEYSIIRRYTNIVYYYYYYYYSRDPPTLDEYTYGRVVVYQLPEAFLVGGSPILSLVVHQSTCPSIWPAVPSLRRALSTNPWVATGCVCGCSGRDHVCCVCETLWVLQRGHSGDGCDLASTLWFLALKCWSMLYVCVRGVMDVVFPVCIVTRGGWAMYGKYECVVMQMVHVCLCILWQFSILHYAWLASTHHIKYYHTPTTFYWTLPIHSQQDLYHLPHTFPVPPPLFLTNLWYAPSNLEETEILFTPDSLPPTPTLLNTPTSFVELVEKVLQRFSKHFN